MIRALNTLQTFLFRLEKERAERENEMFPDEIDTPFDVPARVRFQK